MQLYELADKEYGSFLDLYMDILDNTSVNSKQMTILIKLDFFNEYGKQQHLLQAIEAVNSGKNRYSKTHTEKTKQKRIPLLREELNDIFTTEVEAVDIYEQVMFEKDVLGYATFTKPQVKPSYYVITEINTKWTPTIIMYQIKTGIEEKLKMKKVNFLDDRGNPVINEGDIIRVEDTYERFKNKLVDGKWVQTEEVDKYLVSCTKFVKG